MKPFVARDPRFGKWIVDKADMYDPLSPAALNQKFLS